MASASSLISLSSSPSSPSSPSSTSIPPWNYDVFLSFRGEDTRYNFTDHLYTALVKRGIRTFRDDKLKRGEEIAEELLKVIEGSRFSIIVFSENYAHSRWCLDELVKIIECRKDLGQTVFPIFYHVDPSHVRKQTGSFGEAFTNYSAEKKEKVERWMSALTEAANLSGVHLKDGYESECIKEIADHIFCRLNHKRLDVGANLVGMDSRIKEMILQLDMESNDVRMVGIYGVGGIGKTTIAKVLYNKFSCEFECMSFLKNIREVSKTQGLLHLQNQLLGDILDGEGSKNISNVDHGASMIETVLQSKRVFIVLDDVDGLDQLEYLLRGRDWLGKGSRVIITTRDRHLLTVQGVDNLYEVKELNFEEAYELFCLYAFKQNSPKSDFINLSKHVVYYCQGIPLALKVLGSLLFANTLREWESQLDKLKRVLESDILKVLKISLERLDHTEHNIFLDIACFFKGADINFVSRILDGCNFYAEKGIRNLNDKCLISIPYNGIEMHDLIQQMGWEAVREKYPNEPGKWSRLWDPPDIERALRAYEGTQGVETISLDLSKIERMHINSNVFAKMAKLRLLEVHSSFYLDYLVDFPAIDYEEVCDGDGILKLDYDGVMKDVSKLQLDLNFEFHSYELRYLCWDGYPLDYLPSSFDGGKLIELHLKCSNIKQLRLGNKPLHELKVIDLSFSKKLIQMPEFSSMPNLERLILVGCVSLTEIHPSVGVLKKLTTLNLRRCEMLKGFRSSIMLESLEILDLSKCSSFDMFPEIQGNMRCIGRLPLNGTAIRELPCSIDHLKSIEILDLSNCSNFEKFPENGGNMERLRELYLTNTAIKDLPDSIGHLKSLEILDLYNCSNFEKFPENGGNMERLRELYLTNTAIKDLPDSIGHLKSLEILNLSNCSKFEKFPENGGNMESLRELDLSNTAIKDLPDSIGHLKSLEILYLRYCSKFEKFPEIGGNIKCLWQLYLTNTAIKDLPDSIGHLKSLEILDLSNCSKFEKFPEKGGIKELCNLRELHIRHCKMLQEIPELPLSLEKIDAQDCTSREDLSSLFWSCHLNWLKLSISTQGRICQKLSAVFPASSGILEWMTYQSMGSEVAIDLPMNWYEDSDFLGFSISCVFNQVDASSHGLDWVYGVICSLSLYGDGLEFKDKLGLEIRCPGFNDITDKVCVFWYSKKAISKLCLPNKLRHVKALFWNATPLERYKANFKKCGANLIFTHDLGDANVLCSIKHKGGIGSVAQNMDVFKRSFDDVLPSPMEEPPYKRLLAYNTNLQAVNSNCQVESSSKLAHEEEAWGATVDTTLRL